MLLCNAAHEDRRPARPQLGIPPPTAIYYGTRSALDYVFSSFLTRGGSKGG